MPSIPLAERVGKFGRTARTVLVGAASLPDHLVSKSIAVRLRASFRSLSACEALVVPQSAQFLFTRTLDDYCRSQGIGSVFNGPGELELDLYTLVQPGVFVLPLVNGRRTRSQEETGKPLLFVEILSPSTARFDRVVKRGRYHRYGVEYWIVDLDARVVERWTADSRRPEMMTGSLMWHPVNASIALTIDIDAMLAEAMGER